ncbi:hypothetical protein KSS87_018716, partial [Heliosperma pusillum]
MSYDINIINTPRLTTRGEPKHATVIWYHSLYVFFSYGIIYNNPKHKL